VEGGGVDNAADLFFDDGSGFLGVMTVGVAVGRWTLANSFLDVEIGGGGIG
jgi:hypothetical protein